MSETRWAILICTIVMIGWLIGVGRMLWKRHKAKKEAGDGKKADKKKGEEKAFDDDEE